MRLIFSVAFFYIFMADKEDTMEAYKVDMFLMQNGRYFNEDDLIFVQSILHRVDDSWWNALLVMRFKSTVLALVLFSILGNVGGRSFLCGECGARNIEVVDRRIWRHLDNYRLVLDYASCPDSELSDFGRVCGLKLKCRMVYLLSRRRW